MRLIWFDEVDSTSAEAMRMIQKNESVPPFAVAAGKQSAGKGQRGKTWQSPKGNLYLTLAMPINDPKVLPLLPLFTGYVIADWLMSEFNIPATLKWPNDILVVGKKLGGILCESSVQGQAVGPVFIGVGINLHTVPADEVEGLHATGIAELIPDSIKVPDTQEVIKSFVRHWQGRWPELSQQQDWLAEYRDVMIQPGHMLISEEGQRGIIKSLADDGGLVIWQSGKEKVLRSASESWRWHLQKEDRFVVADVGNTAVKMGLASLTSRGIELRAAVPFLIGESIPEASQPLLKQGTVVYAMSVNPTGLKKLEDQLSRLGVLIIQLKKRRLRTEGEYPLEQLGIDRLAGCEAFVHRYPGQAGIVVSCGTAVTVDLVEADGTHLGGWIVPGMQRSLDLMNKSTAQLPNVTVGGVSFALQLGNTSSSAMRHGVKAAIVGLVNEARRFITTDPRIVITGGNADEIGNAVSGANVEPALLLEGAAYLALAGV